MRTPTQVEIEVAIGMMINPFSLKNIRLKDTFKKTIIEEIIKGVLVLFLEKKKFDKIFINANAGTPNPKYFNALEVI